MANIQKELEKFFKSETGETIIGTIVVKAIDQALQREIRFEDGKTETGKIVEKTEIWNIMDWLVKYLPYVEASIRGCQSDVASARNRSYEVKNVLTEIMRQQSEFQKLCNVTENVELLK